MNASLIRLTISALLLAGLFTSCDKLRAPEGSAPARTNTTVPSAVRPAENAPAKTPAHTHQTQASALPLPSVERVVKSRLLEDCATGEQIMESFQQGFNNTRAYNRIRAVLKDSPASLKNTFAKQSLKADFKSFDDASIAELSSLVTNELQKSLTPADRKDLACEVATFIHSYYINHLDNASAPVKAHYAQFRALAHSDVTTAAAAPAPTATTSAASPQPASAADPRLAQQGADIEVIKQEVNNLYVEQDKLSTRINAISRRDFNPDFWIWASLAGILLLFLLYYRMNRQRTRKAIQALQAQVEALKHADKSNTEEMMRNLLPIYLDQIQRNQAAPFLTDDQFNEVNQSLNTIPGETPVTPAAPATPATEPTPFVETPAAGGSPSPLGEFVPVSGDVWYARAPHNGAFVSASLTTDPEEEQSLFQLELTASEGTAVLSSDLGSLARALANPDAALLQVFDTQGAGNIGLATSVQTQSPAQLRLEHGEWKIVQKGVIVYTV